MIKLDYSLTSPEERNELVKKILEENPDPGTKYLEILADYLAFCMEKKERRENKVLTENHMVTVNKREMSFEGIVSQLENGEDGIYNFITEDKHVIFQPKPKITQKDLDEIPLLRQLRSAITVWEQRLRQVEGKDAFTIKRALIEMRKDQYLIKSAYRKPLGNALLVRSEHYIALDDTTSSFDDDGHPIPQGISLMNPKVCQQILCNYSKLKQDSWDQFAGDTWYLIYDFERTCDTALAPYPIYQRIVELKIDGLSNQEIQLSLQQEFGITHSVEYISSLWRNKIPKLIASAAEDEFLNWYYLSVEKGKYKKCSRCGQVKLAHSKYFSKNKTSRDGWYSICKQCRSQKAKKS